MPPTERRTPANKREIDRLGTRIDSVDDRVQDLRERVDNKLTAVADQIDKIDARQDMKMADFRKETATAFAEVRRDMGELRDLIRDYTASAEARLSEHVAKASAATVAAASTTNSAAIAEAVNPLFRKWGSRGGLIVCGVVGLYEVIDKAPKVIPFLSAVVRILAGGHA